MCRRVIAPLALEPGSLILDDGRMSGAAGAMGKGVAPNDRPASDIEGVSQPCVETAGGLGRLGEIHVPNCGRDGGRWRRLRAFLQ